jgi:putative transposase
MAAGAWWCSCAQLATSSTTSRVQRLMRSMGLAGMAPGPNTSKAHPKHRVYPYLLRGVPVTRLAARRCPGASATAWTPRSASTAWRTPCASTAGLRFNSDQGSQFTSAAFTDVLKREGVDISMDGRGRALDNIFVERLWRNVKHEDVYLKGYANMAELMVGLAQYFAFYNSAHPHQSLGYRTPASVYRSGIGGGALIIDKYGSSEVTELATG